MTALYGAKRLDVRNAANAPYADLACPRCVVERAAERVAKLAAEGKAYPNLSTASQLEEALAALHHIARVAKHPCEQHGGAELRGLVEQLAAAQVALEQANADLGARDQQIDDLETELEAAHG